MRNERINAASLSGLTAASILACSIFQLWVPCLAVPPQPQKATPAEVLKLMNTPPDSYQLMREQNWSGAKRLLDKEILSHQKDEDMWAAKVVIENRLGNYRACFEAANRGLALKKRTHFFLYYRGLSAFKLRDFAGTIDDFTLGIKMQPESPGWYSFRADSFEALGDKKHAEEDRAKFNLLNQLFSSWNKVLPHDFKTFVPSAAKANFEQEYAAGQRSFMRCDYPAAIIYFTRVIKLKPDCIQAYLYRATSYQGTDDWKLAVDDYTKVINFGLKVFPMRAAPINVTSKPFDKWISVPFRVSQVHRQRARCLYGIQKYDEAANDCTVAIQETPDDRSSIELRGNIYSAQLKFHEAITDYLRSQSLTPEYPKLGDKLARCYRSIGDYKSAIFRLSWLIRMCPNDEVNWRARAECLSKLGCHKEAIADLTTVLELSPDSTNVYYTRGREFETVGDFNRAIKDYDKSIKNDDDPSNPSAKAKERLLARIAKAKSKSGRQP